MIDATALTTIRQKKLDALSAKHLHVRRLGIFNSKIEKVDFLGLGVPVGYFVLRFIFKGTKIAPVVEVIWELLAAALLVMTIAKIVYRWQEKAQKHSKLLGENIFLAGHADTILGSSQVSSPESVAAFLRDADRIEAEDREICGELTTADRQFMYREALKESEPGNPSVACKVCHASPWKFKEGSCQTCGNTPLKN